jgi:ATP-binding cassette subfamily B protein
MGEKARLLFQDYRILKRFWPYARPFRWLILASILSIPAVSLLGLAQPMMLLHGIDVNLQGIPAPAGRQSVFRLLGLEAALNRGLAGVTTSGLIFAGLVVAEYALRSLQIYTLQYAGLRSIGRLRADMYDHVSSQSASYFDRNPTGALLTRSTSDIEALGEALATGVVTILGDVFNLVAITIAMLLLKVELTLVSFAIAPVLIVVVNFFRKRLKEAFIGVRKTLAEVSAFLQEHLAGVRIVQLFNHEAKTYAAFKVKNLKNLRQAQASNIYDASMYAIMEGMATLCVAGMLWYGGGQVLQGVLTLGLLVAFIEYIQRVFVPIKEFSGKFAVLQQAVAAMDRVVEQLDTHQKIAPGEVAIERASGSIRFRDVRFRYSPAGPEVLKGIGFDVQPCQVVALVGTTGSGKTTVGKILTRMYDGYEGSVTVDGVELRRIRLESIRSQVGVVQQDVILFNGTIEFNISLGNPAISRERVIEAAKLVQAHGFISALPDGYDFMVAERGANLSAGQAQLLAFARVMAHDPPIVMLDEATASVDSRTEALIQRAIEVIFQKKTVLVIAHRLSTIQAADKILVMQRGEIVESGTHEELLRLEGYYARLYHTGFEEP